MPKEVRRKGVSHRDIPPPTRKDKDGSSLVVALTRAQLKEAGHSFTEKEIWAVYTWWFEFIRRVIEDGTAERISVPYLGNFSPKKHVIRNEIWEALPDYIKESIKVRRLRPAELMAIYADPELSGEYVTQVAKLPRFFRAQDFLFSPNNLTNGRIAGLRQRYVDGKVEQGLAPDDPGVPGIDSTGQGLGGGLPGAVQTEGPPGDNVDLAPALVEESLFTWSPDKRVAEALRTQNRDITDKLSLLNPEDPKLIAAYNWYQQYLHEAVRTMKTYKVMVKSLDKMDTYFDEVDFLKVDSMKRPVYSVTDYIRNIKEASGAHDAVKRFQAHMMEELRNKVTARNNTTLGVREEEYAFSNKKVEWQETSSHQDITAEEESSRNIAARELQYDLDVEDEP